MHLRLERFPSFYPRQAPRISEKLLSQFPRPASDVGYARRTLVKGGLKDIQTKHGERLISMKELMCQRERDPPPESLWMYAMKFTCPFSILGYAMPTWVLLRSSLYWQLTSLYLSSIRSTSLLQILHPLSVPSILNRTLQMPLPNTLFLINYGPPHRPSFSSSHH